MAGNKYITTPVSDFNIRFAVESDIPVILRFINELADYEELSHEVIVDKELLKEHLFGTHPKAEVIIGEYRDNPVGFTLFFHNFSTFLGKPGMYIEDLYIKPRARGNGFGKALLTFLAKLAVERDCGRLEWSVLDWNELAISFYNKLGAEPLHNWTVYRVTGSSLKKLAKEF